VVKVAAIGKEIRREAMHESKHSHHRRQQWMKNTFITKMLLTGGVCVVTGVSGSAYFSWLQQSMSSS
jgi:hypothetical protein